MTRSLLRSRRLVHLAVLALTLSLVACDDDPSSGDGDTGGDTGGGDTTTDTGGDTSTSLEGLVINELAAAGEPADWLELYNGSSTPIALSELALTDDLLDDTRTMAFVDARTLQPGQYAWVELTADGWPGWQLGSAESVWLISPDGEPLDSATWTEGQSPAGASFGRIPDATGEFKTLETETRGAANIDNDGGAVCGDGALAGSEACDDANQLDDDGCSSLCTVEAGWLCDDAEPTVCDTDCGDGVRTNPEQCDPAIPLTPLACTETCSLVVDGSSPVRINEVVWKDTSATDAPDWIELVNTGEVAVDLANWQLADEEYAENNAPLPGGLSIGPGERLVFERDHADPKLAFGFGLDSNDAVLLIDADGALVDIADWVEGEVPEGASFARSPDGSGDFEVRSAPTKGEANP